MIQWSHPPHYCCCYPLAISSYPKKHEGRKDLIFHGKVKRAKGIDDRLEMGRESVFRVNRRSSSGLFHCPQTDAGHLTRNNPTICRQSYITKQVQTLRSLEGSFQPSCFPPFPCARRCVEDRRYLPCCLLREPRIKDPFP